MARTTNGSAQAHGGAAVAARPEPLRAREIALRGIDTSSDLVRFGSAMIRDVLDPTAEMDVKEGNLAIRAGNFTIRSAEYRQRHGEELAGSSVDPEQQRREALNAREASLTAELEKVREQRSGVLAKAM